MITSNEPRPVKVVEREGISAVWLIPAIALIFGAWLLYKAVSNQGIMINIQFDSASGIVAGKTAVRYKGLTVGVVSKVEVAEDLKSVDVEVEMIPSSANMLTDKTLFWYVTADISFQGVKGLDTLLSGSYINIQPSIDEDGDSQRDFIALAGEPEIDASQPGLHIVLQTDALGSLGKNSPVTFKQIPVGYVEGFRYNDVANKVDISVFVRPEHAHLVKENSRFWNASGVEVSASLNAGVHVKTDSFASIIVGGIAFDHSEHDVILPPAESGQKFELHPNFQSAEMGHSIELVLDWNSGIDVGAAVMYQGLTLGKVKAFSKIDPEQRKITADVVITPRAIPYLTEGTEFYVVAPKLDLTGISNVRTMILGNHVGVRFSLSGNEKHSFKVFNQKPAYKYSEPGLHLILKTEQLGSLAVGSSIFYQQQQVGNIQAIENVGPDDFLIHIFIKPQYQNYVATDSRFWNVSGLKISGGLQSFEVQAQSLQSIINGGIAFDKGISDNPSEDMVDDPAGSENQAPPAKLFAKNGDQFTLFASQERAKERVVATLTIPSVKGIGVDTRIMLRGEEIGSVHHIKRKNDMLILGVGLLPEFNYVLKSDTQFWYVRPQVSLSGLTDTDALFGGAYIGLNVGEGSEQFSFDVSLAPPAKHHSADGLQITLSAESGSVVSPGSAISYRGIAVGQVDNVALNLEKDGVDINITIDEDYRHLITSFTRFYDAGGVTISGGISDFIVKTESADAVLKGGISFYIPDENDNKVSVNEGDRFSLYNNEVHARKAGQAITLHFENVTGIKPNMKIKYQDQEVGIVARIAFDNEGYGVTAIAYLNDVGRKFAAKGSQFWFAQPQVGLVGTKNVSALLDGGFIGVLPVSGDINNEKQTEFVAKNTPPVVKQLTYGLNLKLRSPSKGSIRLGNPVLYRQVKVGEVIGVDLAPTADSVEIYINVDPRFAPLVKSNSKFWNTSGFKVEAGIFSGVNIDSESMETLLAGGIAFATPEYDAEADEEEMQRSVGQLHEFKLYGEVDEDWQAWQAKIELAQP